MMRRIHRATRRNQKSQRPLRIEPLEARQLLAVTLPPIANQTVLQGAPLMLPLHSSGTTNPVSYSVSINNANVTATVPTGNPFLKLHVQDAFGGIDGDMVFELFNDRAPNTVAKITGLVNTGFYNGLTFHRVIEDFVIQGGDPSGNGTGGPGFTFDDEFDASLQFTSSGILAMANAGHDTNGSQFFITAGPTRWLDFGYSIFGMLVQGDEIRQQIENVPTDYSGKPLSAVTVTSASVITDLQDGVLQLSSPSGATGSATITVTARDTVTQETSTQQFQAAAAPDTYNDPPFLGAVSPIVTAPAVPVTFTIPATDVEGDSIYYDAHALDGVTKLELTVNHDTGQVTVTPAADIAPGTYSIKLFAAASPSSSGDTQVVTVNVQPSHAPVGTSGVINTVPGVPYVLKVADFGFSDPGDTPPNSFTRLLVTTAPTSGALSLDGQPVADGTYVSVEDIAAGKLTFTSDPAVPHPAFTFQVEDSGRAESGGVNLDPTPKTITFNVPPVAQDDSYTVNESETLDERLIGSHLQMVSEPGDPIGYGQTYDYGEVDYIYSVSRDDHNGIRIDVNQIMQTGPGDLQMVRFGPQLYFAAANGGVLTPGTYTDTVRSPSTDASKPSMYVTVRPFSILTSLYSITGQFTVNQVEYGPSGEVLAFDATFEQHTSYNGGLIPPDYDPAALTGRIQYRVPLSQHVGVLQNDADADGDALSAIVVAGPQHGTLTLDSDGGFLYKPEPGYNGSDSFQYKANDGNADSNVATVSVNVIPYSHAPQGNYRCVGLEAPNSYTLEVADFGFTDPKDTPADAFTRVKIVALPTAGVLALDGAPVAAGDFVSVEDIAAGKLILNYTAGVPHPSFIFQVEDSGSTENGGANLDPEPKTLTFDFAAVAQDDSFSVNENAVLSVNAILGVLANDSDVDGEQFITSIVASPLHGSLQLQYDGSFVYTPDADFSGIDAFQYQASDGYVLGNVATVTINVVQVHQAPSGTTATLTVPSATPYVLKVEDFGFTDPNDSPADGFAGVIVASLLATGTLKLNGAPVEANQFIAAEDIAAGLLTFEHVATDTSSGTDSFTFQVRDTGSTENGGENLDQTPDTLTLSVPAKPQLSIDDVTETEGDDGARTFTFTVSISGAYDQEVRVGLSIVDGTATAGSEYTAVSGVLTWAVGDTAEKTFSVAVNGDTILEADETFFVDLINPVNATLAKSRGVGTIANDDVNQRPSATVVTPRSPQFGDISIHYTLFDVDSDLCSVLVQFRLNGSTQWYTAAQAPGGDGISGLASSPEGVEHTFVWANSVVWTQSNRLGEPAYRTADIEFRITPSDAGGDGVAVTSDAVTLVDSHDITPPSPNPSDWEKAPFAVSTTSLSMTAATATDPNLVEYYFHCLTPGGHDSGWQSSAIYNDSNLTPNTAYTYEVKTRDRFFTPNEGEYSVAASATTLPDNAYDFMGTSGNDVFEFHADHSRSNCLLLINGIKQTIPANADIIRINGQGGNDQLAFFGGTASVYANLHYDYGNVQFDPLFFYYENIESVTAAASSGSDTATLYDSPGDDAFQGLPNSARLTTADHSIIVNNFGTVSVNSTAGNDTAVMFGSQNGDSSYTAGPSGVHFIGAGFDYTAAGFKAISAYAAPGKNNTAVFNSTDAADVLIASFLGAQYIGPGFAYDVWNLTSITGNGGAGDEARFYGSSGGNTVLNLSPTQAVQTEAKYTLRGNNYAKFASYVYPDSNTSATITGTAAAEHAVTSALGAQMTGAGLDFSAWTYKHINFVGAGGADTADMYAMAGADSFVGNGATATMTSGGVDRKITNFGTVTAHGNAASSASFFAKQGLTNTFTASPTQASMSGTGYDNVATGFGSNTGYAIPGGTDVANYTDSAGNDYFISSYLGSQMFGPGYSNAGWSFVTQTATSTGGADTARFYGSPTSADSFVAQPGNAKQTTAGTANEAKNFARVEAYSGLNTGGTAQLTGSTGDDHYVGSPLGAQLWNQNYRVEAWNYGSIKAEGNGGNDVGDLYGSATSNALAADNIFAQFSGGGVSNRVDHFATTKVHGSATGSDTAALDRAYLEMGLKTDLSQPVVGNSIVRKLWLYDFDDVKTTEKPDHPAPQPQPVDKYMTAFMWEPIAPIQITGGGTLTINTGGGTLNLNTGGGTLGIVTGGGTLNTNTEGSTVNINSGSGTLVITRQ
jgi:cyclophilin family peptidyl-prolyl cis-trans isomerase